MIIFCVVVSRIFGDGPHPPENETILDEVMGDLNHAGHGIAVAGHEIMEAGHEMFDKVTCVCRSIKRTLSSEDVNEGPDDGTLNVLREIAKAD